MSRVLSGISSPILCPNPSSSSHMSNTKRSDVYFNSTRIVRNIADSYGFVAGPDKEFRLDDTFLSKYSDKDPNFGYNGLGEVTYYRTYSRIKENGGKERFNETIARFVTGTYEIQRRHCYRFHLPWDRKRAQDSAQEMFERAWDFKFLPPGRGLWTMGTQFMWRAGSACLNNCGFVSTNDNFEEDPAQPFAFAMDMLMLGVGIGFDTRGAGRVAIVNPHSFKTRYMIDDSREGWVLALTDLIHSYTIKPNLGRFVFDYSEIRPAGTQIKGFGGEASGPEGLRGLLTKIDEFLDSLIGTKLGSVEITDLMNMVGKCVVAGNVRRSAEIAFGSPDDFEYRSMKNPLRDLTEDETTQFYNVTGKLYSEGRYSATFNDFTDTTIALEKRARIIDVWNACNDRRWASNNSVFAEVGMDYTDVGKQTAANGEPGYIWLNNMRDYGRMIDGKQPGIDGRVQGANPCFSGNMRLLTENGEVKFVDLWESQGKLVYDGTDNAFEKYGVQLIRNTNGVVKASSVYYTGKSVLYRVNTSLGFVEATAKHIFVISRDDIEMRVELMHVNLSDKLIMILGDNEKLVNITSIIRLDGEYDTYCLTEPENNEVIVNGFKLGQCVEQNLESYELCVGGDTRIQYKDGNSKIIDLVGQEIEIWNGDNWSKVTPRITGNDRKLYRVTLSDGSFLDCTDNHGWQVKPSRSRHYRRVETRDLQLGQGSVSYELKYCGGKYEPYAFEYGMFIGDGYIDQDGRYPMVCICGQKIKLKELNVRGTWYKPQIKEGYAEPYNRLNLHNIIDLELAVRLNHDINGLPDEIFSWDRESILEFVAGWIETDGNLASQDNSDAYRIFGTENHIRDLQLLLRRVGINHASVYIAGEEGDEIPQFGTIRTRDVWCCRIPSYECLEIPTRVKIATKFGRRYHPNPRYKHAKMIDLARRQAIVSVVELPGLHTTYCFDEPENHMGVFGNVLTYQCCLVETFPSKHADEEDYMRTIKYAYLYAKTVTLLPTHNDRTNRVTLRNRRIGLSQSGIVQGFEKFGRRRYLQNFCDSAYNEIRRWDYIYSEWLACRESIKVTSVKPSGTVSLLAGVAPGIHFPEARSYWRRMRINKNHSLVKILSDAGYHIEPAVTDPDNTVVVRFGVEDEGVKPVSEVSIWEQMDNVAAIQHYWADNAVSVTIKFTSEEANDIPRILEHYEDRIKAVSFLPKTNHGYVQAPYEAADVNDVREYNSKLGYIDMSLLTEEGIGEKYCDSDKCTIGV